MSKLRNYQTLAAKTDTGFKPASMYGIHGLLEILAKKAGYKLVQNTKHSIEASPFISIPFELGTLMIHPDLRINWDQNKKGERSFSEDEDAMDIVYNLLDECKGDLKYLKAKAAKNPSKELQQVIAMMIKALKKLFG